MSDETPEHRRAVLPPEVIGAASRLIDMLKDEQRQTEITPRLMEMATALPLKLAPETVMMWHCPTCGILNWQYGRHSDDAGNGRTICTGTSLPYVYTRG